MDNPHLNSMNLLKFVHEEDKYWSKIFLKEIKNHQEIKYSSYWWENYYFQIINQIKPLLYCYKDPHILEAGSGSGKASILLGKNIKRTFLDISSEALKYAKFLSKKFDAKRIKFVKGNIFSMPFKNKSFDFVWNIGVIEHYSFENTIKIVQEMSRVLKSGGIIALGVPNFVSGPIIKARILNCPIFRFIKGYRTTTECNYSEKDLKKIVEIALTANKLKICNMKIIYVGNPLPIESPKLVILSLGKIIEYFFPKNKFLKLIIYKVK